MKQSNPIFVGFFPKKTYRDVTSMEIPGIVEVCAVSECISEGPENWIDEWQHNDFGFYDTETKALGLLSTEVSAYDMYAYQLYPFRCLSGKREQLNLEGLHSGIPPDYDFLGYDIVTKTYDFFECSPLSCNGVGKEFSVNKHCLIESLEDAEEAFHKICEKSIGEPGPYYLFAVYRKHA